jgi:hypothetical protein
MTDSWFPTRDCHVMGDIIFITKKAPRWRSAFGASVSTQEMVPPGRKFMFPLLHFTSSMLVSFCARKNHFMNGKIVRIRHHFFPMRTLVSRLRATIYLSGIAHSMHDVFLLIESNIDATCSFVRYSNEYILFYFSVVLVKWAHDCDVPSITDVSIPTQ